MLFIYEVQRIESISINLKIIIDQYPEIKVLTTGSFSFDLANKITKLLQLLAYQAGNEVSLGEFGNALHLRNDAENLWENFFIVERMKYNHYHQHYVNPYFLANLYRS
jgi:hypothetical protein